MWRQLGILRYGNNLLFSGCHANVGEVVKGLVVYVDLINGHVHILLDKRYIAEKKGKKSNLNAASNNVCYTWPLVLQ